MSKTFKKAVKKVSLKNRLYIMNSLAMVDAIVEAGYRKDVGWSEEENEQLAIINDCARKLTESQLKLIENKL